MSRFIEVLDDYVHEDNPIRAIDMFINSLDLAELGFARCQPAPACLLITFQTQEIRPDCNLQGWFVI